jgi:hypothetical protein
MGWEVLNLGSVEKDGVLDVGFDVALICIGACMGGGREDEGGGGTGGGGRMIGRETGIGEFVVGRLAVEWVVVCKVFQAMAKAT